MFKAMAFTTCALALGLTACSKPADNAAAPATGASATSAASAPPAAAADAMPATALVALAPTKDSKVSGTLTLTQEKSGGVSIVGQVGNLEPGSKHGFHVHDKGDCSAPDGSSAGGHFNPTGMEHGDPSKPDGMHHVGDMMNIEADAQGTAQVMVTIPGATLHDNGPNDLIGKGIIVHAAPDDYMTQPSGNSGARLACGRIA
jgi:superoxide dismutase, Cu-Zn family